MRKPEWMMTLEQAESIERIARRHGLDVEELVDEVLDRLGIRFRTFLMRVRLVPQLEWLLAGEPLELAPYYRRFHETGEYPFRTAFGKMPPQVEVTIDEFIALAERLDLQNPEGQPDSRRDLDRAERFEMAMEMFEQIEDLNYDSQYDILGLMQIRAYLEAGHDTSTSPESRSA